MVAVPSIAEALAGVGSFGGILAVIYVVSKHLAVKAVDDAFAKGLEDYKAGLVQDLEGHKSRLKMENLVVERWKVVEMEVVRECGTAISSLIASIGFALDSPDDPEPLDHGWKALADVRRVYNQSILFLSDEADALVKQVEEVGWRALNELRIRQDPAVSGLGERERQQERRKSLEGARGAAKLLGGTYRSSVREAFRKMLRSSGGKGEDSLQ